tara:strand:- start:339 stop:938 length:600 start_codon:yes stop_codon:yes gene_type:complete
MIRKPENATINRPCLLPTKTADSQPNARQRHGRPDWNITFFSLPPRDRWRYPIINLVNSSDMSLLTFSASRWRFFTATALSSLSIGIAIYCLTRWLGIPYGWAVFLVVIRAAFWACIIDIRKFDVTVDGRMLSGPSLIFSSQPVSIDLGDVDPEFVTEWLGVFSVHDSAGNEVMAHYRYYIPEDRVLLRGLIERLRRLR